MAKKQSEKLYKAGAQMLTFQQFYDLYGTDPDPAATVEDAAWEDQQQLDSRNKKPLDDVTAAAFTADATPPSERDAEDDLALSEYRQMMGGNTPYDDILAAVATLTLPASQITGERVDRSLKLDNSADILAVNRIVDGDEPDLLKLAKLYRNTVPYKAPKP